MTADKLKNTQKYKLFIRKIENKIVNGNKIVFLHYVAGFKIQRNAHEYESLSKNHKC